MRDTKSFYVGNPNLSPVVSIWSGRKLFMQVMRAGLCVIALVLGCGCAVDYPVYPVTDGFHKALPQPNTRSVIWGDHPTAVGTVTTWLQKRGLTIVERARLQQIFNEQQIRLTHTPDDEAQVLRVGKLLGAQTVVFVDASFQKELRSHYYEGSGGAAIVYSAGVSIRGVNVETSEVVWSGTARYPNPVGGIEDALAKLTCQALATAWGFRPPGQHEFNSQAMCQAGESNSLLKD
jgi:hypothetical protein